MAHISEQLATLHQTLKALHPDLSRIAVALYDPDSNRLSTFADSSDRGSPLLHYSASLSDVPSLNKIALTGQARVIQDLRTLSNSPSQHTQALLSSGYLSSVTMPVRHQDQLLGFIFFNADKPDSFSPFIVPQLEIAAYAISLLLVQERNRIETLQASLKAAVEVTHQRNPETGEHLKRIAGFVRLITNELAPLHAVSDEYVEHLILFSALHDIGKIGIPDDVLLKPGKLTPPEFEIMKSHTQRGRELIDNLIENHTLASMEDIDLLRNIIELHHEHWDGSGYPRGLRGEAIPLEARIVAVADVFDALTSERPYKDRMSADQAFRLIASMRGTALDPSCVDAFIKRRDEAELILRRFRNQQLIDSHNDREEC